MYELDKPIKSFAVANEFVQMTNKACYALGQQLQPFCIYGREEQKSYGTIDVAEFSGMLDQNVSLVSEIANQRLPFYQTFGLDLSKPETVKLLFFDFLLSVSACYVEIPKWVTKEGVATPTYDKFLCTKNPSIMANWMGITPAEAQAKWSAKCQTYQAEFMSGEIRFVKLMHSAKGNSISAPRTSFSVKDMVCIPLYMLYAWVQGMKPILDEKIIKFSFLKDNGTVRELCSTLNSDIIMSVYQDNNYVSNMLSGVDISTVQQGGLMLPSKINRGYIKVPELGSSIYDSTGCRSLNLARLLKAEVVDKVDTTFIRVDLTSVVPNFADAVDYLLKVDASAMKPMFTELTGGIPEGTEPVAIGDEAKRYAESRCVMLSTTFQRSLHLFMVGHPQWFPLYTGTPNQNVVSSSNKGNLELDF